MFILFGLETIFIATSRCSITTEISELGCENKNFLNNLDPKLYGRLAINLKGFSKKSEGLKSIASMCKILKLEASPNRSNA